MTSVVSSAAKAGGHEDDHDDADINLITIQELYIKKIFQVFMSERRWKLLKLLQA